MPKVVLSCAACGALVERFPSKVRPGGMVYCDWDCRARGEGFGRRFSTTCEECAKQFLHIPGVKPRFCSPDCKYQSQRLNVLCSLCGKRNKYGNKGHGKHLKCISAAARLGRLRVCTICGGEFEGYGQKRSQNAKFCSVECFKQRPLLPPLLCVDCGGLRAKGSQARCQTCYLAGKTWTPTSRVADNAIAYWAEHYSRGLMFAAEHRVSRYRIDLALPFLNLAIELDGEYWHGNERQKARDRKKDVFLASRGWTVMRVPIRKRSTSESLAADMDKLIRKAGRRGQEVRAG